MAFWEMLQSIMGYGYPPGWLSHGILGNVAKHYGIWVPPPVAAPWHSGKCCKALWDMGNPPPGCGQTNKVKLLPSRRTTYAGGNDLYYGEQTYIGIFPVYMRTNLAFTDNLTGNGS